MKTIIIILILLPLCFPNWRVLRQGETRDCYLAWLEDDLGQTFVLKQIKSPDPSEQFLLVVDAAANQIGCQFGIPVNRVWIIPAHQPFPGKRIDTFPATLHTMALGLSAEERIPWKNFTLHQRYSDENVAYLAPIPNDRRGLTMEIIQNLFTHSDLQKIAALDTFLGNGDRSRPNIFYDAESNRFLGIDMAASFRSYLARVAHSQISAFLPEKDKVKLSLYRETLQQLYQEITPEFVADLLDSLAREAGFYHHDYLNNPGVFQRSSAHKKKFTENYQHVPALINLLWASCE